MTNAFLHRMKDNSSLAVNCTLLSLFFPLPSMCLCRPHACLPNGETPPAPRQPDPPPSRPPPRQGNQWPSETQALRATPSLSVPPVKEDGSLVFSDTAREEVLSLLFRPWYRVCRNALTKLTRVHVLVNLMDFIFSAHWSLPTHLLCNILLSSRILESSFPQRPVLLDLSLLNSFCYDHFCIIKSSVFPTSKLRHTRVPEIMSGAPLKITQHHFICLKKITFLFWVAVLEKEICLFSSLHSSKDIRLECSSAGPGFTLSEHK